MSFYHVFKRKIHTNIILCPLDPVLNAKTPENCVAHLKFHIIRLENTENCIFKAGKEMRPPKNIFSNPQNFRTNTCDMVKYTRFFSCSRSGRKSWWFILLFPFFFRDETDMWIWDVTLRRMFSNCYPYVVIPFVSAFCCFWTDVSLNIGDMWW